MNLDQVLLSSLEAVSRDITTSATLPPAPVTPTPTLLFWK